MSRRFDSNSLVAFAASLLHRSGLEPAKAQVVAEVLVEGDLLGHTTHGLQLLPSYLQQIEKGTMTLSGEPRVIADFPAAITWDGMRLPGPWLVRSAIDQAAERAAKYGTCTVSIRRSHHTACLSAYLMRATEQNMMAILCTSDPGYVGVAPHGGRKGLYSTNPITAGWPNEHGPVMVDMSTSIASMGVILRAHEQGTKLPGKWLLHPDGHPTDDPAARFADPPAALLPVGGLDHGHKGYGLALLVEALTSGLAGFGRADPKEPWTNNVYIHVLAPALFGGAEEFVRQTSFLADACQKIPPREGVERVRLPGEASLQRRREQLEHGVHLYPAVLPALQPWAEKLKIPQPQPIATLGQM
jgi:LDH2 family malate/lactate/ureidoglycolate dehydrogenase